VPASKLLILVTIFFLTSLISVVTGSTSLITVPVMIDFLQSSASGAGTDGLPQPRL
jgi:uncharacterized protein